MSGQLQCLAEATAEFSATTEKIVRFVAAQGGISVDLVHDDARVREMSDETLAGLLGDPRCLSPQEKLFSESIAPGSKIPKDAAKWIEEIGLPFWRELRNRSAAAQELYRRSTEHGPEGVRP